MTKEEAKQKAEVLELRVLESALDELDKMSRCLHKGEFILNGKKPCKLTHIQETVKLAHQIRSLINLSAAL